MALLNNLPRWVADNVERAVHNAVREALWHGLEAGDFKRLVAAVWAEELRGKAELGRKEIAS